MLDQPKLESCDHDFIKIPLGEEVVEVPRRVVEESCLYYKAMFTSSMEESQNNVIPEDFTFSLAARRAVAYALDERSVVIEADESLDILRLITHLLPMETTEGQRLDTLAKEAIDILAVHHSAPLEEKVEALIFAVMFEEQQARDLLANSIDSETSEDIYNAVQTFELDTIILEAITTLISLSAFPETNRVDRLRAWAESSGDLELTERLGQSNYPCQTACGAALRMIDPPYVELENTDFIHEVAMFEDVVVYGTQAVQLRSLRGDLLETNAQFYYDDIPYCIRITADYVLVLGRRRGATRVDFWDRSRGEVVQEIRGYKIQSFDVFEHELVTAERDGYVCFWDMRDLNGKCTQRFNAHGRPDTCPDPFEVGTTVRQCLSPKTLWLPQGSGTLNSKCGRDPLVNV